MFALYYYRDQDAQHLYSVQEVEQRQKSSEDDVVSKWKDQEEKVVGGNWFKWDRYKSK